MVAMLPLLSSPFSLRCNKTKGKRRQQCCFYCLLCYVTRKKKHREGNGSNAIVAPVTFFSALQQNRRKKMTIGDVAITFFVVLQGKKTMKTMLLSPSSLHCNKKKGRR